MHDKLTGGLITPPQRQILFMRRDEIRGHSLGIHKSSTGLFKRGLSPIYTVYKEGCSTTLLMSHISFSVQTHQGIFSHSCYKLTIDIIITISKAWIAEPATKPPIQSRDY
jgi:hypothetical protein